VVFPAEACSNDPSDVCFPCSEPVASFAPSSGTVQEWKFYGGDAGGTLNQINTDSLLVLNCETGERRWHFQTVHHDLWDYDLPAQPVLAKVRRNGKELPALAQVTKTGFVFLFHRLTGEPLFEIEKRPVPKSDIPGEETWPTQSFPLKPPAFARQSMRLKDITDVTPESRKKCLEMVEGAVIDVSLFYPIGEKPTVLFPGLNGGGGASKLHGCAGVYSGW
jgi:glucose dehydrogenase